MIVEGSIVVISGRESLTNTEGAPGEVSRSAAGVPKIRVARCFAAVGIVDGVGGEVEGAHVG